MMMIDILLSIRPCWDKKIFEGVKTVELRKSAPQIKEPFRVYLYETKAGLGLVVGECICWMVEKSTQRPYSVIMREGSLLDDYEISEYARGRPVYGWYLSKVAKYKNPRPLSALGLSRAPQSWCYIKESA